MFWGWEIGIIITSFKFSLYLKYSLHEITVTKLVPEQHIFFQ